MADFTLQEILIIGIVGWFLIAASVWIGAWIYQDYLNPRMWGFGVAGCEGCCREFKIHQPSGDGCQVCVGQWCGECARQREVGL